MLTQDFITWLSGQTIDGKHPLVFQGPVGPESIPQEHIIVTPVPGGGMQVDGHIEQRVYQIKTVGPMGLNPRNWNEVFAKAEALALAVDKVIMNTFRPIIGGEEVVYTSRFGTSIRQGGPSGQPLDKANRPSFQTMYVIEAVSTVYDN